MTGNPAGGIESGKARYQMLDVWRGLVCLLVLVEHVGVALWPESNQGVGWDNWFRLRIVDALTLNIGTPLFFVMSGYCIASSLTSAARKGTSPGEFLVRRAWRIFPTYWAALLGFVAVVSVLNALGRSDLLRHALALELDDPSRLTFSQWLGNLTLTETWRPRVGGSESAVYTRVAWSLCYQEQFYAVCCLALWLTPGRVLRSLAWASLGIVGFRVVAADCGAIYRMDGTFPLRWHEFAVGLAVYWRLNTGSSSRQRRWVDLGLAALAVIGARNGSNSTTAAAVFGLMLIAAHKWDAASAGLTCLEPLRACGRRSFSIYLTHLPVTVVGNAWLFKLGLTDYWARAFISVPLVAVASLAVGWAFYRAVECRFLGAPSFPRLPRRSHSAKPAMLANVA